MLKRYVSSFIPWCMGASIFVAQMDMRPKAAVSPEEQGPVQATGSPSRGGSQVQADKDHRPKAGTPGIRIGKQSGDAGSVILVPVNFAPSPDVQWAALDLEVSYPAAVLEFVEVQKAKKVTTEKKLQTGSENGFGKVKIRVSPPSASGLFPAGVIAFLVFRIKENAAPGKVRVAASARIHVTQSLSSPQEQLHAVDGLVEVLPPRLEDIDKSGMNNLNPYVSACFFYMH
ncbi:MAG: hypothetical protein HY644_01620 [Acidobacteria bacterium]|nr:hypothetical protein [Acidobacteriota bacterium]